MEFRFDRTVIRITHPDAPSLLAEGERRLASGKGFALATINLDHLVKLGHDPAFRTAYASQDLVVADGNPVVWLSRLARKPVALVPGSDLVVPLVERAAAAGRPVALVGSTPEALDRAASSLQQSVPGARLPLRLAPPLGFDPTGETARGMLTRIASLGPCLCLVALGAPKQERFAALGRELAPQAGFAAIGAGVDFLAGTQTRAPAIFRSLALEWLWRAALSPRRLVPRYAACVAVLPSQTLAALRLRRGGA